MEDPDWASRCLSERGLRVPRWEHHEAPRPLTAVQFATAGRVVSRELWRQARESPYVLAKKEL
jgi:hypothetical protein